MRLSQSYSDLDNCFKFKFNRALRLGKTLTIQDRKSIVKLFDTCNVRDKTNWKPSLVLTKFFKKVCKIWITSTYELFHGFLKIEKTLCLSNFAHRNRVYYISFIGFHIVIIGLNKNKNILRFCSSLPDFVWCDSFKNNKTFKTYRSIITFKMTAIPKRF